MGGAGVAEEAKEAKVKRGFVGFLIEGDRNDVLKLIKRIKDAVTDPQKYISYAYVKDEIATDSLIASLSQIYKLKFAGAG
jgi:hypothetical protein